MAVGFQNAEMFYHAGVIAWTLEEPTAARQHFERSLALSPHSRVAYTVRQKIQEMNARP